jgi:hypothetical protein
MLLAVGCRLTSPAGLDREPGPKPNEHSWLGSDLVVFMLVFCLFSTVYDPMPSTELPKRLCNGKKTDHTADTLSDRCMVRLQIDPPTKST